MAAHLLDVNALIAPGWNARKQHDTMVAWFNRHAQQGWATCAFTQAGFVRVLSQPAPAEAAGTVTELARALEANLAHPAHRQLALDFGCSDVLACCTGGVVGHRQVTDAWLLTAAVRAGLKLLTFDHGIDRLLASDAEREAHVLTLA